MTESQTTQALVTSKQNLQGLLEKPHVNQTLDRVSTRWLSAGQLKTQAALAVARNPALLKCTQYSFLESMVRAAELGLRFAGAGGEAYLIPFKNQASLIIGYCGLCALARRTGKVTRIEARCVHERDHFNVSYGSGQQLTHRPHIGEERGQITCAYALAELKGGEIQLEVMTKAEIDAIRKRSRAGGTGPWKTDYEEMARKTALRRLCKFLPFPTAFEDALAAEEPPKLEEQRRQVISQNVDFGTGEVITGQDFFGGEQPEHPATAADAPEDTSFETEQPQGDGDRKLINQKAELMNEILTVLGQLHPGDDINSDAARLKSLKYIFGKTILDDIAKLPAAILEVGLKVLKAQAKENSTETE